MEIVKPIIAEENKKFAVTLDHVHISGYACSVRDIPYWFLAVTLFLQKLSVNVCMMFMCLSSPCS